MCAHGAGQNAPNRVNAAFEFEENEAAADKAGVIRHWRHEPKQNMLVSRDLCERAQLMNIMSEVV